MDIKEILRTKNRFKQKLKDSVLEFERKESVRLAVTLTLPGSEENREDKPAQRTAT